MYYGHRPLSAITPHPTHTLAQRSWWMHAAPSTPAQVREVWATPRLHENTGGPEATLALPSLSRFSAGYSVLLIVVVGISTVTAMIFCILSSVTVFVLRGNTPGQGPALRPLGTPPSLSGGLACQPRLALAAPRVLSAVSPLDFIAAGSGEVSLEQQTPVSCLGAAGVRGLRAQWGGRTFASLLASYPALAPCLLSRNATLSLLRHGLLNSHTLVAAKIAEQAAGARLLGEGSGFDWALSRSLLARGSSSRRIPLATPGAAATPKQRPTLRTPLANATLSQPTQRTAGVRLVGPRGRWVRPTKLSARRC